MPRRHLWLTVGQWSLALALAAQMLAPWVGGRAAAAAGAAGRPDSDAVNPLGVQFSANPTTQEIFRAPVFQEPLVPVGGEPGAEENRALAAALGEYSSRATADDFSSVAAFLQKHPRSVWKAALLTGLGLDYYETAYYSLALDAWREAWSLGQKATNAQGKFLADRAVCELAGLYSRLGRMRELEALLKSIEQRVFIGGATERISLAREALWMMQNQPGISFRCGPLALQSIKRSLDPEAPMDMKIFNSASTQKGFSLPQVAELSKDIGLNYQMAYREPAGEFVIPSVVHWKAGHYAALVRQVGDRYLLQDPTFGKNVWATRKALEAETSGYFLVPSRELPRGWRNVDSTEGGSVWGKGITSSNDPDSYTPDDLQAGECSIDDTGMAVSSAHLMLVSLQIRDTPVGYTPPVGPPVRFTIRYNHRDVTGGGGAFGPNWTHDWTGSIQDTPFNPLADVKYFVGGGGARTFTGFDTNTQTFAPQHSDQTRLKRTGPSSYDLIFPDGSKRVFGLRQGNSVRLTQVVDPAGNAVTLTYDGQQRLVTLTDAIGQVTTLSYNPTNAVLDRVTDPFGRMATFEHYRKTNGWMASGPCGNVTATPLVVWQLYKITDVVGLTSTVVYEPKTFEYITTNPDNGRLCTNKYGYEGQFIVSLQTPYGRTSFSTEQSGTTRTLVTTFPDASRERVEFNQNTNSIAFSDPAAIVPKGMNVFNQWLHGRNTFYWSRTAGATGYGDYSKAKIYHWLHAENLSTTAGTLESVKEPLEGRVWYAYPGQSSAAFVGTSDKPRHIGRVLDDTTTQLYTYSYNDMGHVTETIDPLGRKFNYVYASNGIDLLEIRQTRGGNNELLFKATYNDQHRPLTTVDAAGQTNTFSYNARGQILSWTNPKNETTTYTYNPNGYLLVMDGPLPGTNDVVTFAYDPVGRVRTMTGVTGYKVFFDYDAMDRLVRLTHPDSTFTQYHYDRLDLVAIHQRDGQLTYLEYDNVRQLKKTTDPLGRVTQYSWCRCGSIKSLIDAMGRSTQWHTDIQGRLTAKEYSDGSRVSYFYEHASSRLREVVDEKGQRFQFAYNRDNTLRSKSYANSPVFMAPMSYSYDPDYVRVRSTTDGTGTTLYSYNPISGAPALGAGQLAASDGPLPNDTMSYGYDELGRNMSTAIGGVATLITFDPAGRVVGETNALGDFIYSYDASSPRMTSQSFPNNQVAELSYAGNLQDQRIERITHRMGANAISEFLYTHEAPAGRIKTWSQQAGLQSPHVFSFGYDAANQLLSAMVTNAGALVNQFSYSYDPAANRSTEQIGDSNYSATYNALNQISTSTAPGTSRTNEWDAEDRLIAVNNGGRRTEFAYDHLSRLASLRLLTNGVEASFRRFVWCGADICEERDATGVVTKRYFPQGMKVETGPATGNYFYTRDHLGSIREVIDAAGTLRARYAYDPYGRRTQLLGDMEADFGFAGMFWSSEANLSLTLYRAYDPELGRWLSRDPLDGAELKEGSNLYAYVGNDPINDIDPLGLISTLKGCFMTPAGAATCAAAGITPVVAAGQQVAQRAGPVIQSVGNNISACVSRMPTLPGIGPYPLQNVTAFVNTAAASPLSAQSMAVVQKIGRVLPQLPPEFFTNPRWYSTQWYVTAMDRARDYLSYLRRTDPQAAKDVADRIWRMSFEIFGLTPK